MSSRRVSLPRTRFRLSDAGQIWQATGAPVRYRSHEGSKREDRWPPSMQGVGPD
jgi:hypothetical protein